MRKWLPILLLLAIALTATVNTASATQRTVLGELFSSDG